MQDYRAAEAHFRQLERLDASQAQWALMVAACLHAQGFTPEVPASHLNFTCIAQCCAMQDPLRAHLAGSHSSCQFWGSPVLKMNKLASAVLCGGGK